MTHKNLQEIWFIVFSN